MIKLSQIRLWFAIFYPVFYLVLGLFASRLGKIILMEEKDIRAYLEHISGKGGKKGVGVLVKKLTPKQRSHIARNAVMARWATAKDKKVS